MTKNAGAFVKGEKRPKQGRPKGSTNKATQELKEMILGALDEAGGVGYLVAQAHDKPVAFLALIGKVLPLQVNAAHNGNLTFTLNAPWLTDAIAKRNG